MQELVRDVSVMFSFPPNGVEGFMLMWCRPVGHVRVEQTRESERRRSFVRSKYLVFDNNFSCLANRQTKMTSNYLLFLTVHIGIRRICTKKKIDLIFCSQFNRPQLLTLKQESSCEPISLQRRLLR